MNHIVYMSRAVRPLSDQDLQELLAQCRRDNARHNVTGILFYSHGNIAQLIEGDPAVIEPLYEKISRDGRHSNVQQLANKAITERSFPDWSMAFHPIETEGFHTLEGFFLPHQLPATPETLTIADALIVDLVRQAVFGPDAPTTV
ncbi:BLUF domain-containing protein [Hymenobacter cellulosilyticus]|uniref:BLUF domain-containing protein n=1 Tax=Hymenobacter cellulosilyticus TaxID=2932248 RepID=A0A8T9Q4T5_9BACT|nr:BLUF domain-containing protein [Hymenobacter cellulosilyticus]UOQ72706.1 BLUF domain-containing protein [Hymenobacter cellulosilyticus]